MVTTFFAHALEQASTRSGWRSISMPVASLDPVDFAFDGASDAASEGTSVLWDPSDLDEPTFAGSGAALEIALSGDLRADLALLAERSAAVFRDLSAFADPGATGAQTKPRFFGGLGFASRPVVQDDPWSAFGPGRFTLPRWAYAEGPAGRTLTLTLAPDEGREAAERDRIAGELLRIGSYRTDADSGANGGRSARVVTEPALEGWCREIAEIRSLIRCGAVRKVVAARRTRIDFEGAFSHRRVVRAIAGRPMCTRFAFRRAGFTFLGATPELLVKKRGVEICSEALAGSARPGEAQAMRASPKERAEHALVVDFIAEALGSVACDVEYPAEPEVRRLDDVVHLITPFSARLDQGSKPTVLDLLGLLHPTPAVAGVPRARALEWIGEHELFSRGWYAGPVGWFGPDGDGEIMVALRSALLGARSAHLFAGAGIVEGSDPFAEYEEARLKERTLRRALGVEA